MMPSIPGRIRFSVALAVMLCLAGALCSGARADFDRTKWRYYKELVPESGTPADYAQFDLDKGVYRNSRPDLADLRMTTANEAETPYKLIEERGEVTETPYVPTMLNKSIVPGKYVTFVLDLGRPGMISNRLTIETPSTNFMQRVEIAGSQDELQWAILKNDGSVFDFSHEYKARSTSVSYPQSTYRYIRVRIWTDGEKPIAVNGATLYWRKTTPTREILLYGGKGSITQNSKERSTDILLDMECSGLPGERLSISSPDKGYNREVIVSGSRNREEWTGLGSGYIMAYNLPKFKARESSVKYHGEGYRYIRVRIYNFDDQPITVSSVEIYGIGRRVVFPCKPGMGYKLYYGNSDAEMPVYDFQEAFKYLQSQPTVRMRLGPEMKNSAFTMPIATKPWLEANPWILWVVLVAAVVILGLITVRLIRQTKETPTGQ